MKISHITGFLLLLSLIGGCDNDYDLHRTIFIRDKNYPDLPEYSEWGYNTFGAFINDDVFVSGDYYEDPASLYPGDTMFLLFHGEKRTLNGDTAEMLVSFGIPRFYPLNDQYLLTLNDSVIDLVASASQVQIMSGQRVYPVTLTSGQLHFNRVQNLIVDYEPMETILSGTFEFQGLMEGNPVSFAHGRFDVGVFYYSYKK